MKYKDDVIVIGSGVGGLSASAFLARKGYNLKIFERLHQPGGFVHTFKRKGYIFEASTHQLTGFTNKLYLKKTQELLGIQNKLQCLELDEALEAFIVKDNTISERYPLNAGYKEAVKSLTFFFPEDKLVIKDILSELNKGALELFRLKRLMRENPLLHPYDLFTASLLKYGRPGSLLNKIGKAAYPRLVRYMNMSFKEVLAEVKNPELYFLLSLFSIYVAEPPSKASGLVVCAILYLILLTKPATIKGGTGELIKALTEVIEANGGEIEYKSEVSEIIVKDGTAQGVRLANGEEHYAKWIVSNGTAHHTFRELIKEKKLYDSSFNKKLDQYKPSSSAFQIYLILPFDMREYGFNYSFNYFSSGDNEEVGDISVAPENRGFVITNYAIINPEFYPEGKTGVVIIENEPIDRWINLDKKIYRKQKADLQELILNKTQKITGIPFDKAEVCFSGTPKTMAFYSGDPFGGIVGAANIVEQSALNRFEYRTPIKNLYIAGADSQPAGGVSSCLDSGVIVGREIMSDG